MQNAIENDKGKQPLQRKRDKRQKVSTTAETLQNNRTHTHIGMGESGESIAQRIEERKVPIVAADAVALILRRRQKSNKQQQMQTASKPLTEKPPPNPSPKLQHPFNHPTAAPPIHPLNPTKHKQTRENRAKQCN